MCFRLRSLHPSQAAAALACALLACACSAVKHGYSTADYADQTFSTNTGLGSERLAMEIAYDQAVADLVTERGRPAYLRVTDRNHLYLFYPERDVAVSIKRGLLPPGEVVVNERIPGHFFRWLPQAEVARIQARRSAKKRARPTARRPARAVAPPAARRDPGVSLSDFDLDAMVARFRVPLSAADAGVSGWRIATLADGTRTRIAHSGRTEFRIQRDAVIAAVPIASNGRSAPPETRSGFVRVNRAVFGTRADAINRSVTPLVDGVAADPSGRTRVVRRVAGRTLSVLRDTRRGLLVYRVAAD